MGSRPWRELQSIQTAARPIRQRHRRIKMELDPGAFAYECEIKNGKVTGSPFGPMSTMDSLGHMPVSVAIDDRDINKHVGEPSRTRMCHGAKPSSTSCTSKDSPPTPHGFLTELARHLCRPRPSGHALLSAGPRRDLHRTAAHPSQAIRTVPAGTQYAPITGAIPRSAISPPKPRTPPSSAQEAGAAAVRQEVIDMVRAIA